MSYAVQTPVYEGPFDLLLHLILREQVDLYEVSLRTIVDGYLAELEKMERLDLEIATEFLLIAATLVELKSRRLLPIDDDGIDLDDELALWEERDLLLARLLECKTYKDAAAALRRLADLADRSAPRRAGPDPELLDVAPDLLGGVTPIDLKAAFLRALAPRPVARVDLSHVTNIRASVSDAMAELIDEVSRAGRISFRDLTSPLVDRIEIVVRFLAVLELFKQELIDIDQPSTFGDLVIVWLGATADVIDLTFVDAYDG